MESLALTRHNSIQILAASPELDDLAIVLADQLAPICHMVVTLQAGQAKDLADSLRGYLDPLVLISAEGAAVK